ncbi:protein disulfide-isomerase TMX3-like [Sycon ciliatum]|uniref:protein disulfide-isomerase TMX3-like n=1 Tax=Sycon ciliatum TaxID=27933 RepID=UPI0020ADA2CA|eukprot:scpid21912/ scgid24351/ Protein disulfide-isomerase TMX3; Thioredoxin domain-containing protein 10; Thioredoxin-related transmembrane protein 3
MDNRFVLLSLLVCVASGKVIDLDERLNDEKVYKHGGSWIVMFYAPWCAYCEKMKPAWEATAKHLAPTPVHVARVDLTKYPSVGEHHKVEGMPTIKMFHDGEVFDYDGKRDSESILEFVRRVMNPPVGSVANLPSLKSVEKSQEVFFILSFSAGRSSQLRTRYQKVASNMRMQANFFETSSKDVHEKLDLKATPSLAVYRDGRSVVYDNKNLTQEAIEEWVQAERYPLCPHLDQFGIYDYIHTKRPVVVTLIGKIRTSKEQKLADYVRFIAYGLKFYGDFYFATTDEVTLLRRMLLEYISKPAIVAWDFETRTYWIFKTDKESFDDVTQEDVENFLGAIKSGEIPASGGEYFTRRFYRMLWLMVEMVMDVYETSPWVVIMSGIVMFASLAFCAMVLLSPDPEKANALASAQIERDQLRRETPGGFYNDESSGRIHEEDEDEDGSGVVADGAVLEPEDTDERSAAAKAKGKLKHS